MEKIHCLKNIGVVAWIEQMSHKSNPGPRFISGAASAWQWWCYENYLASKNVFAAVTDTVQVGESALCKAARRIRAAEHADGIVATWSCWCVIECRSPAVSAAHSLYPIRRLFAPKKDRRAVVIYRVYLFR